MRDHSLWSVNLGRWGGVPVRLHLFFVLFAAFTLYLSWVAQQRQPADSMVLIGAASLLILLISVLLHELGHCYAATVMDGIADQVVIGPFGGLAPVRLPHEPRRELLAVLAGPMVNFLVCLACAPLLLTQADVNLLGLLHPLKPHAVVDGSAWWVVGLKLTFWINWLLVLINLVPAFPLDGGRALRAGLLWLLPDWGERNVTIMVALLARLMVGGLLVMAWLLRDTSPTLLVPTWFALVLLAIFLFFSAKQEMGRLDKEPAEEALFGYDFSEGYTSFEANVPPPPAARPGPLLRWLHRRREVRQRRRQQLEAEEERRVDEILARLHKTGIAGLSADDRALLNRVSARYRSRLRS